MKTKTLEALVLWTQADLRLNPGSRTLLRCVILGNRDLPEFLFLDLKYGDNTHLWFAIIK